MQSIFNDERQGDGLFQRGPTGVGPKSLLALWAFAKTKGPLDLSSGKPDKPGSLSEMLDGEEHRLALFSSSGAISVTNAARS